MDDTSRILLTQIPLYVIIIILAVLFFIFRGGDGISYKDIMEQMNQRDSIISQMIDAQGRLVIEHTNRQFSPYIIQNSNDPQFAQLRRDLEELKINQKDLKAAIRLNAVASGEGATKIVLDTLETYTFNDTTSSKFLKLEGLIDLKKDSLKYDYTYTANYNIYSYQYKKKFWKRPEMRIKLVSDDPSNQIRMQTFTVKPPLEVVSIGVGLGASFYYTGGEVGIAPSITIGVYKPIYTFRTKK
jgi:hypothetical protein